MSDECLLWYMVYGSAHAQLFPDEASAIRRTLYMEDDGSGAVDGVQFADGRYIDRDDWTALEEERTRLEEEMWKSVKAASPKPPPSYVKSPTGRRAWIDPEDVRSWMERG